jgi:hypothetical protein
MLSSISQRWKLLGAAAVMLALVAAGWPDGGNDGAAEIVEVAKPARTQISRIKTSIEGKSQDEMGDIHLEKLRRMKMELNVKSVFTANSWEAPPPSAKTKSESSSSTPSIPFTYLGKLVDQDTFMVFLSRQDRNYVVKEGDVIDDVYHVDEIKGSLMSLTYIPLNMKQTMRIGEPN